MASLHLPGLNGIRAFASLAVVVSHTTLALNEFGLNNKIFGVDKFGNANGLALATHAVTIFFVLSGFLITFLTLNEKEKYGRLDNKKFYVRRILRIWPLYYLYLIIAVIAILVLNLKTDNLNQLPFYIFLMANIPFVFEKGLPLVTHYWSLGVEEQFYLFFPQIAKLKVQAIFKTFIIAGISLFFLKVLCWYFQESSTFISTIYKFLFVTRFHSMFLGGVGAMLFYKKNDLFLRIFSCKIFQLFCWMIILLLIINKFHIASVIDSEIIAVISLGLIIGQITGKGIFNLEHPLLDFLGKISFGIYVIHPLVILLSSFIVKLSDSWISYLSIYLLIIILTIFVSYLSYEFMEKKFLKIKVKYSVIHSSSTADKTIE